MAKIAIDLLPLEFKAEEIKGAKFLKVQTIGVLIILLMIFLSSLTVALRILQNQSLSRIQTNLTNTEQKINGLKTVQASLLLLKNRLTTINQYLGTPSQQSQMYKLITSLLPASVYISSISVNRAGEVLVSAVVPDSTSLDNLVGNLISQDSNQDKISKVSLESISRGKDGIFRISLKIKPK